MTVMKRIDVGNRVKADVSGQGDYEAGRITGFDKSTNTVTFTSVLDGTEVKVNRAHAEKCSQKELESFQGQSRDGLEAAQELKSQDNFEREAALEVADRFTEEAEQETPDSGDLAEDDEEGGDLEEDEESRSIVRKKYRQRYQRTKDADGKQRVDNGDPVAAMLRGKELETVYTIAAAELGEDSGDLEQRYCHLNPGQQRMVLGNKLRALYRRQAEEAAEDSEE